MSLHAPDRWVVVESVAGWNFIERSDERLREAGWATTSPYVWERLTQAGRTVAGLDEEVGQEEADRIGYMAIHLARRMGDHLDEVASGWPHRLQPGSALRSSLHRLFTVLFYKGWVLHRFVAAHPDCRVTVVGRRDCTPVTGFNVTVHRFDTLFAVLGSRVGLETVEFDAPQPAGGLANGDFLRPNAWTRLATVLSAPTSAPLFRIWQRLLGGRAVCLAPTGSGHHVFLHGQNELMEEMVGPLLLKGATIQSMPPFKPACATAQAEDEPGLGAVPAVLNEFSRQESLRQGLEWNAAFDAAAGLAAERILGAWRHGRLMAHSVPPYVEALQCGHAGARCTIATNGFVSPAEKLIRQELDHRGISVYTVEHGVSVGLSPAHLAAYRNGLPPDVRHTIYFNACQQMAELEGRVHDKEATAVVGVPRLVRHIGLRSLQRRILRAAFRVKGRLVVWITGLYPNNYQYLPHYWRDMPYHRVRCRLVSEVFGKCRDTVMIKLYPTCRYVDGDPFADPGCIPLPANCRIAQFSDFRSLRAVADVLVIDTPSSALGWSWGTGKPLIYLETGMYTVLPDVAEEFRKAMFFIDGRTSGWERELQALLELPAAELAARYDAKAEARRVVGERYVLGPPGSAGQKAAGFILNSGGAVLPGDLREGSAAVRSMIANGAGPRGS